MKAACPRLFEAEALRDGRLTGVEVSRFQTHIGICPICAREVQALEALAESLRSETHASASNAADELHVRRERMRLLAAFDGTLASAPRSDWATLRLPAIAALVALCAASLLFAFSRSRPMTPAASPMPAASVAALDPIAVRADATAKWSRETENDREKFHLDRGTLSIRVHRKTFARRLVVVLPDGELEDIGTTFTVSADGARTTRVTVQEGSVVLRLRGQAPVVLGAGDVWPLPSPPATAAPSASAPAPSPVRDPSADFRAAMSALRRGDEAQAAARFAAFIAEHPRDSRAEDAAYLRVLALQRGGDATAMHRAAREYLRRYPRGFRRAEVEALTR